SPSRFERPRFIRRGERTAGLGAAHEARADHPARCHRGRPRDPFRRPVRQRSSSRPLRARVMMFRRSTVRYGATPEPETPYQRAGQLWDERIGSARIQARNWRFAFFGMLALSSGLAGGLVWQSVRGTVTPCVVELDKLGQAQAVAPAVADYRPTDPQIAWHLAHFKCARCHAIC